MSRLPFPIRENIDDYYQTDDVSDFIGNGTFAQVFRAECCHDGEKVQSGQQVALKVFQKSDLTTEKIINDVINEVEILRRVEHPNCVRLLDYFQTTYNVVIVMNLVEGKELLQALRELDLSEACVKSIMAQLLSALAYLHDTLRVVHRDIKPENILVSPMPSGAYHVTVVDFGLARTFGRQSTRQRLGATPLVPMQRLGARMAPSASMESLGGTDSPLLATPCGTLRYAAPETVHSISASTQLSTTRALLPRIDVYAAGIVMYVMLSGAVPFSDTTNKVALYGQMKNGPSFSGQRWEHVLPEAIDVSRALMTGDPVKRPSAAEALRFGWFNGDETAQQHQADSQSSGTLRLPPEEILGERDQLSKAFDAMISPQSTVYGGVLDEEEATIHCPPIARGSVAVVPFGVQNQRREPPANNYFDF